MAEIVSAGSSEVPAAANHTCSNEDGHDSSSAQDTDNLLMENTVCNNKTVTEAMISDEMPEADPTVGVVPVLQTGSAAAAAEAIDADKDAQTATGNVIGIGNGSRHSDVEQPSVNGNGSAQQPYEGERSDASCTEADDGLKLAVNQAKKKFVAFQRLDHPASVVIDLRSPPLVQVCLLHGADDVGAGGSGSSRSTGVPRRPQTARRGRRSGVMSRKTSAVSSYDERVSFSGDAGDKDVSYTPSNQLVADNDKKGESATAELSTIIRLKVVDTAAEKVTSGYSEVSPVTDNAVSASRPRCRHSDADQNSSESSDDNTMKVRNVNRTYSRNPSVQAARKNPQLISIAKSADNRKGLGVSLDFGTSTRPTSQHAQESKFVPKKLMKTAKQRPRVGPAWFSRRFLNAPPPELWECERTSKTLNILKRPNYNAGIRRVPIVANPPVVKQLIEVPVVEEADIAIVGNEQLKLWRLSEEDVSELQSQLRQEAEHRRSEHIMPLVMQMTDAQIEDAYEQVAESMKTYEIVEADSDEDMAEDEESEEDAADDFENSTHLETSDGNFYEEIGAKGSGETEYARLRPKRHAVDYGPAAFTPIMIMEGRRMFSQRQKSNRESRVMLAATDTAVGAKLQRQLHGHKSRRRRRKKSNLAEQQDEIPGETPVGKCTDDSEDTPGYHYYYYYCRIIMRLLFYGTSCCSVIAVFNYVSKLRMYC